MRTLVTVVSGGQSGVDQAALRAAQACGLAVGGWCPPGRACEGGIVPAQFPLQETPQERSRDALDIPRSLRSEWNVRDADATLILQPAQPDRADPGTDWSARCAARYQRPVLVCDPRDPESMSAIARWLDERPIRTLNVAGPSEGICPGIGNQVYALLVRVFRTEAM